MYRNPSNKITLFNKKNRMGTFSIIRFNKDRCIYELCQYLYMWSFHHVSFDVNDENNKKVSEDLCMLIKNDVNITLQTVCNNFELMCDDLYPKDFVHNSLIRGRFVKNWWYNKHFVCETREHFYSVSWVGLPGCNR
jgi:hypothetical protein